MTQKSSQQFAVKDTFCPEQLPNQLTSAEYQEFECGSGIHPDIIKLNFFHLEGNTALDRLFIAEKLKRINTGTVSVSILKRYRHIEAGGLVGIGSRCLKQIFRRSMGSIQTNKAQTLSR